MSLRKGFIIALIAIGVLAVELVLFSVTVFGLWCATDPLLFLTIVSVGMWLTAMTLAVGVIAPVSAAIEYLSKKQNLSFYIFFTSLGVTGIVLGALLLFSAIDSLPATSPPEPCKADVEAAHGPTVQWPIHLAIFERTD